jgi:chorismate synthase
MTGSSHNDPFFMEEGRVRTRTNLSGGIQGGISNGEAILLRVAFKPTATIRRPQETVDEAGRPRTLEATGRHDPCVVPRAVAIVEAMAALTLADHWVRQIAVSAAAERIDTATR